MTSTTRFALYVLVVAASGAASALTHVVAWAWLSSVVSVLGLIASFLETPPAARRKLERLTADLGRKAGPALVCLALGASVLGIGATVSACTPAQQAEWSQIEQTVLSDLAAGKTREQILADVGSIVAGRPGADVAIILDDALEFLIDAGVIPADVLRAATKMHAEEHPIAQARRAARAASIADGGAL